MHASKLQYSRTQTLIQIHTSTQTDMNTNINTYIHTFIHIWVHTKLMITSSLNIHRMLRKKTPLLSREIRRQWSNSQCRHHTHLVHGKSKGSWTYQTNEPLSSGRHIKEGHHHEQKTEDDGDHAGKGASTASFLEEGRDEEGHGDDRGPIEHQNDEENEDVAVGQELGGKAQRSQNNCHCCDDGCIDQAPGQPEGNKKKLSQILFLDISCLHVII